MSMLDMLSSSKCWNDFYEYKISLACPKPFEKELKSFIDERRYILVCDTISFDRDFALPKKSAISKMSSQKKRTVYTYPKYENMVLKLLTYLLIRKYNYIFSNNLYSFRMGFTAKDAVKRLTRLPKSTTAYSYKVDISDYFNSVNVDLLIPILAEVLSDDKPLLNFLTKLLQEPKVADRGKIIAEKKGIMAGTPLASFYANLFLKDLDKYFYDRKIPYARYSDDIIVFGETKERVEEYANFIKDFLSSKQLSINPKKEVYGDLNSGWTFLGFSYCNGVIDISPITVNKLKGKMRRKTHALMRWAKRNKISGEKAASAFIRIFNRKLLESPLDNELTWSYWFFSVINTSKSLNIIDNYAQDCIRFLISGKRTKSRFNVRYDYIKSLGYKSLVNAYYKFYDENSNE